MKIWVDDVRTPPYGFVWAKSVNQAIEMIELALEGNMPIDIIDLDHDAGDFAPFGGDYIRILDWLEMMGYNFPIRIHSMNPVGVTNMKRIIQKNGWTEVKMYEK